MRAKVERADEIDGDLAVEPKPKKTDRLDLLAILIQGTDLSSEGSPYRDKERKRLDTSSGGSSWDMVESIQAKTWT